MKDAMWEKSGSQLLIPFAAEHSSRARLEPDDKLVLGWGGSVPG